MSLDVLIHGMPDYNICYGHFMLFRKNIVKYVYGDECYRIYNRDMSHKITDDEIELWNSKCDDDLDIFLMHSDCDGKFTVSECRKIRDAMKRHSEKIDRLDSLDPITDKYVKEKYGEWFRMFSYCARHRVIMRFC